MMPKWMKWSYKILLAGFPEKQVRFYLTTYGDWWVTRDSHYNSCSISLQEFLDRVNNEKDT